MYSRRRSGFSLLEVVILIVVLAIGFAGIVLLFNQVTRASVDPLVRKQALAIAASVMEEVQLKPFTFCDPDDASVYTAATPAGCTTQEGPGPEVGELRATFDNVSDYDGFEMGAGTADPITTAAGTTVNGVGDYHVRVTVVNAALDTVAESLLTTVVATHVPSQTAVTLRSYRTRYAPTQP